MPEFEHALMVKKILHPEQSTKRERERGRERKSKNSMYSMYSIHIHLRLFGLPTLHRIVRFCLKMHGEKTKKPDFCHPFLNHTKPPRKQLSHEKKTALLSLKTRLYNDGIPVILVYDIIP